MRPDRFCRGRVFFGLLIQTSEIKLRKRMADIQKMSVAPMVLACTDKLLVQAIL
jgi:hypothetical protein